MNWDCGLRGNWPILYGDLCGWFVGSDWCFIDREIEGCWWGGVKYLSSISIYLFVQGDVKDIY